MTEKEAIRMLARDMLPSNTLNSQFICDRNKAHEIAIKALEKQIPKKPLRDYCLHCPRCEEEAYWNTEDGQQKFKYCHNCGQKLDWND